MGKLRACRTHPLTPCCPGESCAVQHSTQGPRELPALPGQPPLCLRQHPHPGGHTGLTCHVHLQAFGLGLPPRSALPLLLGAFLSTSQASVQTLPPGKPALFSPTGNNFFFLDNYSYIISGPNSSSWSEIIDMSCFCLTIVCRSSRRVLIHVHALPSTLPGAWHAGDLTLAEGSCPYWQPCPSTQNECMKDLLWAPSPGLWFPPASPFHQGSCSLLSLPDHLCRNTSLSARPSDYSAL